MWKCSRSGWWTPRHQHSTEARSPKCVCTRVHICEHVCMCVPPRPTADGRDMDRPHPGSWGADPLQADLRGSRQRRCLVCVFSVSRKALPPPLFCARINRIRGDSSLMCKSFVASFSQSAWMTRGGRLGCPSQRRKHVSHKTPLRRQGERWHRQRGQWKWSPQDGITRDGKYLSFFNHGSRSGWAGNS